MVGFSVRYQTSVQTVRGISEISENVINARLHPRVPALIREILVREALKGGVKEGGKDGREMRPSGSSGGRINRDPIASRIGIHIPITNEEVKGGEKERVFFREGIEE